MKGFVRKAKKGFTLVELVIVLVIMGIVAAVGVPSIVNYISHTAERTCTRLMKDTVSSIRSAAVSKKHESCAAVSIEVYKVLDSLPPEQLSYPNNVYSASSAELEALEQGRPADNPLRITLSAAKSAVEGETYAISWEFKSVTDSGAYMAVNISCNKHGDISVSDNIPLTFGSGFTDITLPPKADENKQAVYDACEYFLKLPGWKPSKGNKFELTLDIDGKHTYYINNGGNVVVKGDKEAFAALAKLLSEQSGKQVETVEKMTVYVSDEGRRIKSVSVRFAGDDKLYTYLW